MLEGRRHRCTQLQRYLRIDAEGDVTEGAQGGDQESRKPVLLVLQVGMPGAATSPTYYLSKPVNDGGYITRVNMDKKRLYIEGPPISRRKERDKFAARYLELLISILLRRRTDGTALWLS
jgi:hypothetical protein